jgi:hypothetical protein
MTKYFYMGLVLAAVMSITPAYGDTNLLKNPGFEDGTDGWEARGCKIESVTTPVHSGAKSVKAIERAETWQGVKQSLIGKVVNGKTYKISGWVRLDNSDSDNIILSIEMEDDNPPQYINLETLTCSNTEWTELSGEFTPSPSGTLKTLDIYFEGPAADVNFFVDDVNVFGPAVTAQAAVKPEPNTPAKVEPNAPKAEPNAPKAEPNAPKTEPNAPPKHVKAKVPAAKMSTINDSTVVNTKNEAVVGSQKQ